MGGLLAITTLLADVGSQLANFVEASSSGVYILLLFAYILTSWIRLPYRPWLNRVQRFLYDVCDPYLRIFRRFLPPLGPLDLSPMVASSSCSSSRTSLVSLLERSVGRRAQMAMTPVEIRHVQLGRSFRGYKRELVDRLLTEVADSFEDVWRERADLADKVEQLELDLVRHKELEGLLRTTLVSAESASQQLREQAARRPRRSSARRTPRRARSRAAPPPRRSGSTPSCAGSGRCSAPRSTASTTRRTTSASPSASPPARSAGMIS